MIKTPSRWKLSAPVGAGQPNRARDVRLVQQLLNRMRTDDPRAALLAEDGVFGPRTRARLLAFQHDPAHLRRPDAVVAPHGPTAHALAAGPHVPLEGGLHAQLLAAAAEPKPAEKAAWVNRALGPAIQARALWIVPVAVTIAQGALASNWGRYAPGNRFFSAPDSAESYGSLEEAASAFARMIGMDPQLKVALPYRNDPDGFVHSLAMSGFGTGPDWEARMRSVMAANGLKDYDDIAMFLGSHYRNAAHVASSP